MMNEMEPKFLDLAKLLSGEVREISFDVDMALADLSYQENGITVSSLGFSGRVLDHSGFPRLTGTVSAKLSAPCARCLAPVEESFSASVDSPVSGSNALASESEEEVIVAQGQKIDLAEIAETVVLTGLPLRLLCREDCQGLCPKCGKDLNTGDCNCEKREIDPRLAGLADFFKQK